MKGIVFTLLGELVEEKFGPEVWDKVLIESDLSSQGVYTAGATYPEAELRSILATLSKLTQLPIPTLIQTYGQHMFHKLASKYPQLVPPFNPTDNKSLALKDFLKTIDQVIHVEVLKLHPAAELPKFTYEDPAFDQLVMKYQSPRKLCALAEGLIKGASEHYKTNIHVDHPLCMHKGNDHCRLELKFLS